jgi:predicted nucleotidyltransferase
VEAQLLVNQIVQQLQQVNGLVGIVLGGSRARGTHTATSDIDLGLYYDPAIPPDLDALRHIAAELDDMHRPDLITPLGGWGPWINGGGWLTIQGLPTDFLYRDLAKVTAIVNDCCAGQIEIAYQPGHPHGFVTSIYMAEIAHCQLLWDPTGALGALKAKTHPYPPALRKATLDKFWWEVQFALDVAQKAAGRGDTSYVAGCCFRAVACLMQTLFALNRQYLMNEKGAVALAAAFPLTPPHLQSRIDAAFATLSADPAALHETLNTLKAVVQECAPLVSAANK